MAKSIQPPIDNSTPSRVTSSDVKYAVEQLGEYEATLALDLMDRDPELTIELAVARTKLYV
jgi:hypothetical protein